MKTLGLLLLGLLLAGCPKTASPTSEPTPDPTPSPRAEPEPEPEPTPEASTEDGRTDARSARVLWAIVQRGDEASPLPDGLTSAQASRDGSLQLVHGSPRAMPTDGGWTTLAVLGDESAKKKVSSMAVP